MLWTSEIFWTGKNNIQCAGKKCINDNKICCASTLPHVARTEKEEKKRWKKKSKLWNFDVGVLFIIRFQELLFAPSFGSVRRLAGPPGNDKSFCWFSHVLVHLLSFDSAHIPSHHGISISWIINFSCYAWYCGRKKCFEKKKLSDNSCE